MTKKGKEEGEKQKIRIKMKAYDPRLLENSCREIVDTILRHGVDFIGPIPLPVEIRRYTVNRSSFIHKDSREQFETRIHKRIIDIVNPNKNLIEALMNISLPAGVEIEIKM